MAIPGMLYCILIHGGQQPLLMSVSTRTIRKEDCEMPKRKYINTAADRKKWREWKRQKRAKLYAKGYHWKMVKGKKKLVKAKGK